MITLASMHIIITTTVMMKSWHALLYCMCQQTSNK